MKNTEFDAHGFAIGDKIIYNNIQYDIATVDFEERLIGIVGEISNDAEAVTWKRSENCEFVINPIQNQ